MPIADAELKKLLSSGVAIAADDLQAAEEAAAQNQDSLAAELVKRKLIGEKDLLKRYASSLNLPFAELANLKIPRDLLLRIPERVARKYQAILFGQDGENLQLAMADPEDFQALDFITKQIGSGFTTYLSAQADIAAALDQYKGNISSEITKAIKDSAEEEAPEEVSAKDVAEDAPITKTVNVIIEFAIKSRASDIHIEPREGIVQVRYRIDGVLRETMTLPRPILPAVVSRIKILANLKIDEHRTPQDGRFKFTLGAKAVALRVSTLPVMDGEKVVMRLLDESSRALTLEELGFEGRSLDVINRNIHKPHGMVLVTGPTGSGKSTTLYSILNLLNSPGVNISTVEDPVEYRIMGVNQTQVNPKAGMNFANGLRALLRQDPDILMVGEIRDAETADLGVQAALTGHVVLSTLHTNNAATSLPRLLDMRIEPFLIASTVNTVIGQRLVRRLCQVCRVAYVPETEAMKEINAEFQVEAALKAFAGGTRSTGEAAPVAAAAPKPTADPGKAQGTGGVKVLQPVHEIISSSKSILDKIADDPNILNRALGQPTVEAAPPKKAAPTDPSAPPDPTNLKEGQIILYRTGAGCDNCSHLGYIGRMGIYEVLEVDESIRKLIMSHASSDDIQAAGITAGMLTMQQDGFLKSLRGLTTIEEILRVTRE